VGIILLRKKKKVGIEKEKQKKRKDIFPVRGASIWYRSFVSRGRYLSVAVLGTVCCSLGGSAQLL